MKSLRKILDRIMNSQFLIYFVSVAILFIYFLFTDKFVDAVVGSLFFGLLALPTITPIVLGILDILIPDNY